MKETSRGIRSGHLSSKTGSAYGTLPVENKIWNVGHMSGGFPDLTASTPAAIPIKPSSAPAPFEIETRVF